jgi:nitroreductase
MSILEQVKARRSVRTFNGIRLSDEKLNEILKMAEAAENPWHLPITWKILDAKEQKLSCPVITGTDTYIGGKMKRALHAEEAFGYTFEKVVLYAQELGIGTTWIAGTMNRSAFERAMGVKEGEVMPCVSPLGYPAKKMSLRESVMRKGVKADVRLPFEELFFEGSFAKPLSAERAGALAQALEAVRLAPSAVNKQPWRAVLSGDRVHFYEKPSKGYAGEDGWDLQKVDLGIALCHFEMAAKECGFRAVFEMADPGMEIPEGLQYIASFVIA